MYGGRREERKGNIQPVLNTKSSCRNKQSIGRLKTALPTVSFSLYQFN